MAPIPSTWLLSNTHGPKEKEPSNALAEDAVKLCSALVGTTDTNDEFFNPNSVYCRIKDLVHQSDDHLDPSPIINAALSDLVAHLQGVTVDHTKSSFAALQQTVCNVIDNDPILKSYARDIRSVAERAESRLELFYVQVLLRSTYERRSVETSYVECIRQASAEFPYTSNYDVMVHHEARVIQSLLPTPGKRKMHVVFCGSGPLPLTGLFLAANMNCNVTLVDCDAVAVRLSKRLITMWETRCVLPEGRVKVVRADGADLRFRAIGEREVGEQNAKCMACDALFLAALIPNGVKETLVKRVSGLGDKAPLVVLRSAHGLTARFAYDYTRRFVLTQYLPLVATVVPETHAIGDGMVVDDDLCPKAFFPPEILNSIEIYGGAQF